jgi:CHAD domain-containing protein
VQLATQGAPPLTVASPPAPARDVADVVRDPAVQQALLAWIVWRHALTDRVSGARTPSAPAALTRPSAPGDDASLEPKAFHRAVQRRLRRWHARLTQDRDRFDALDDEALHALRKRIKRQRYAIEFFAPALKARPRERYLRALSRVQDRMGALNDLFVARARYRQLVDQDPAAWFALGWLAARIVEARAAVRAPLRKLARCSPPGA